MIRQITIGCFVLSLIGCTSFNVIDHDDGTHVIVGYATALKKHDVVLEEVKEKAENVCEGNGYEIIDPATGQINPNYNLNVFATSRAVSLRIKCNAS
ncbi:hypothetical protein [Vibrio proteolyticus]